MNPLIKLTDECWSKTRDHFNNWIVFHCRVFSCGLKDDCTNTLALALESSESRLTELNVGYNRFTSDGVERISRGVLSPSCELMKLWWRSLSFKCKKETQVSSISLMKVLSCFSMSGCQVSVESCKLLSLALEDSFLVDLDLSSSWIGDAGLKQLCAGLSSPRCQMQILRWLTSSSITLLAHDSSSHAPRCHSKAQRLCTLRNLVSVSGSCTELLLCPERAWSE